jgi:D-alanine-D-alanine ligase
MKSGMNIVLTYDPRWEYKPKNQTPVWASLDTVDYVAGLLENMGYNTMLVRTDDTFEHFLNDIKLKYPQSLVFWLNEFMATRSGVHVFTLTTVEKVGLMHTGPSSAELGIGLNKETSKNVFRKLNLPTPESVVVQMGDFEPIYQDINWEGFAIIKPLLQGGSKGIDEYSVVNTSDHDALKEKVEKIRIKFNEPAIVEQFIGGLDAKELSAPVLISNAGGIFSLPILELDLNRVSNPPGRYNFLTQTFKDENRANCMRVEDKNYLQVPAALNQETINRINSDVARIVNAVGCRDMARVDIRGDSTSLYYIEINVNPGKNRFSYLLMSAYSLGLDYSEILAFIPYQALIRYGIEPTRNLMELVTPVKLLFEKLK